MENRLNKFIDEQILALKLLYDKSLITPLLMILYATIDIFGYISGFGFETFVKKYMQPNLKDISPADLWGGRCAMLHSNSPKSEHSQKGKARQIMYSWGTANVDLLKTLIKNSEEPQNFVAIKIETLCNSLITGIEEFKGEIEKNIKLQDICSMKVKEFYCNTKVQ